MLGAGEQLDIDSNAHFQYTYRLIISH